MKYIRTEEIYEEIKALTKDAMYSGDRHRLMNKYISELDNAKQRVKTHTIAVGGYKVLVTFVDDLIISIAPKSSSAGRGEYYLDPHANDTGSFMAMLYEVRGNSPYRHFIYYWDSMGSRKLQNALMVASIAAVECAGDREVLYKAIGGHTDHCAVCGADLTDPESVARGVGPECWRKIYVDKSATVNAVVKNRAAQ